MVVWSVSQDGAVLAKDTPSEEARIALGIIDSIRVPGLRDQHRENLTVHRVKHGF
jgi:hypothetical protein